MCLHPFDIQTASRIVILRDFAFLGFVVTAFTDMLFKINVSTLKANPILSRAFVFKRFLSLSFSPSLFCLSK